MSGTNPQAGGGVTPEQLDAKYSQTGESRQLALPGGGAGLQAISVSEAQALVNAAPADVATWSTTDDSTVIGLTDATVGDLACYANGTTKRLTSMPPTTLGNWTTVANQTTSTVAEGSNLYFTTARVLATALTGWAVGAATTILSTDSVTQALGKAQGQLNSILTSLSGKASTGDVTGSGLTMTTSRLLGRTTASTGAVEEMTVGAGLLLSAGSLAVASTITGRQITSTDSVVLADFTGIKNLEFGNGTWNQTVDCSVVGAGMAAGDKRVVPWFKVGTGTTSFLAAGGTTIHTVPGTNGLTCTQWTQGTLTILSATDCLLTGTA